MHDHFGVQFQEGTGHLGDERPQLSFVEGLLLFDLFAEGALAQLHHYIEVQFLAVVERVLALDDVVVLERLQTLHFSQHFWQVPPLHVDMLDGHILLGLLVLVLADAGEGALPQLPDKVVAVVGDHAAQFGDGDLLLHGGSTLYYLEWGIKSSLLVSV